MRLLFLPHCRLSRELGGSKIQLALADHLRPLGWDVESRFPFDSADPSQRAELRRFDVVDWDPCHALQRRWLPSSSLSLCRFALLALHFEAGLPWPRPAIRRFDPLLDPLRRLRGRLTPRGFERQAVGQARRALALADAIAVMNTADRQCLLSNDVDDARIVVVPSGLSEREHGELACIPAPDCSEPVLAFLGTFDYRKGCLDLAWLLPRLAQRFPSLRLRLIGTNGLIQGEAAVRSFFPSWLQSRLQVVPTFPSDRLLDQLRGVSLGVFPSYLEGFGIAVIEQLAAGIPVIAYDAPGPGDILPSDWLVPRGDRTALLERLAALLESQTVDRGRARSIATPYRWDAIARCWDGHYRRLLAARRA